MPQDTKMSATAGATLNGWAATALATNLRNGRISAAELMEACLDRITLREPEVKAWAFLDIEQARERAKMSDARRKAGLALGPLHGLPIGVKDVFDTADMPSEYGSQTLRGRRPARDADAISILRNAGAIVIGKTATSEFGMYHPSPTRNPIDLSRSPGVSSSGSAAAVVDHMMPLGLGTQHTASTTLPASFCGAFAFKPSLGFTSMAGSNVLVPRLAHVGLLARSTLDLCLFASAFDPAMADVSATQKPPQLGVVRGPGWSMVDADARIAFEALLEQLSPSIESVDLPAEFDDAPDIAVGLLNAHLARRFGSEPDETVRQYCRPLREGIAAGRRVDSQRYLALDAQANLLVERARAVFGGLDALITLSALGEATRIEDGPGTGVMSMPWSLCGLPTVSLPLLTGARALPIGVQLIGRHGRDADLLRVSMWLEAVAYSRRHALNESTDHDR